MTYFCYILTKTKLQHILLKILYTKDHENLSSGSQVVPCRDMIKNETFFTIILKMCLDIEHYLFYQYLDSICFHLSNGTPQMLAYLNIYNYKNLKFQSISY